VQYIISLYSYLKSERRIDHTSIFEFLRDPDWFPSTYNHFTRIISGAPRNVMPNLASLAIAKRNIKNHFEFIGLTEQLDVSLSIIGKIIGQPLRQDIRINVTPKSAERVAICEDEILSLAADHILLDLELYKFAQERFFLDFGTKLP
jgi:hypothetical protein